MTCGEFTCEGNFVELSERDLDQLEVAWQEAVLALYLAEKKIEPEVVENMRSWEHSGFSVDQSVSLPAGDQAGIERLVQYMTRCPFSLSRLVKLSDTGQVVYKAEKDVCRAFPDPQADGLESRRPAEFPGPFAAGVFSRVHSAHSTQGISSFPLLRLVLEQEPRNAEEGSRGSSGRVTRS